MDAFPSVDCPETVSKVAEDVASVEVPTTVTFPLVTRFPNASTRKLRFSVHAVPFQYNVEVVAVPFVLPPVIVAQYVEVPFVASTWPAVPVALLESRSSPVTRSLLSVVEAKTVSEAIVVEDKVVKPVTPNVPPTISFPITVEVPTVEVLAVRYVVTALVVVELPMMMLVMFASVANNDAKNPLVLVEFVIVEFVP